jgi:uncharacterized protein
VGEPERQCIGCGRRGPQSGFLRLAIECGSAPARVVVAGSGSHSGRSAYLCRRVACLDRALHRKAFQRAFRGSVVVVQNELAAAMMFGPGNEPGGSDGR